MAGNFVETTRLKLRRLLGTSLVSDVDEGFQRLAEDCDTKLTGYTEGTLAERPAAGISNRIYGVTSGAGNGLYHDTGSAWAPILALTTASAYEAQVTRLPGTEYEASATRPVLVMLEVEYTTATVGELLVGGVKIMTLKGSGGETKGVTFLCPPGAKWKATAVNALKSSYLVL